MAKQWAYVRMHILVGYCMKQQAVTSMCGEELLVCWIHVHLGCVNGRERRRNLSRRSDSFSTFWDPNCTYVHATLCMHACMHAKICRSIHKAPNESPIKTYIREIGGLKNYQKKLLRLFQDMHIGVYKDVSQVHKRRDIFMHMIQVRYGHIINIVFVRI